MKYCSVCDTTKSLAKFWNSRRAKDGKQYLCIACARANNQDQYTKRRQWFVAFKATQSCIRCGFDNFAALDFHHRDPSQKRLAISVAVQRGWKVPDLLKEIAKCNVFAEIVMPLNIGVNHER